MTPLPAVVVVHPAQLDTRVVITDALSGTAIARRTGWIIGVVTKPILAPAGRFSLDVFHGRYLPKTGSHCAAGHAMSVHTTLSDEPSPRFSLVFWARRGSGQVSLSRFQRPLQPIGRLLSTYQFQMCSIQYMGSITDKVLFYRYKLNPIVLWRDMSHLYASTATYLQIARVRLYVAIDVA
jgi:hypothetical protein